MLFAHDTEASLQAAVDLINSGESPDTLATQEQVDAWYAKHRYTGRRDRDAAELADLRAIRPVLRDLLTADRHRAAARAPPPRPRGAAPRQAGSRGCPARAPPRGICTPSRGTSRWSAGLWWRPRWPC